MTDKFTKDFHKQMEQAFTYITNNYKNIPRPDDTNPMQRRHGLLANVQSDQDLMSKMFPQGWLNQIHEGETMNFYNYTSEKIAGGFTKHFNRLRRNYILKRFMTFYDKADREENCKRDM